MLYVTWVSLQTMGALRIEGVNKSLGGRHVLRGVSLHTPGHHAVGILGASGAGKSTLMRLLAGELEADAGSWTLDGLNFAKHRQALLSRIAYIEQQPTRDSGLTVAEYLHLAAEAQPQPVQSRTHSHHHTLAVFGLKEIADRPLARLSQGVRQRTRLAGAMAAKPRLLLIDAPTERLLPHERDEFLSLLRELPRRADVTLLLATRHLADIERVCQRVVVLGSGQTLYSGTVTALVAPEEGIYAVQVSAASPVFHHQLRQAGCEVTEHEAHCHVRLPNGGDETLILAVAARSHTTIRQLCLLERTLERAFPRPEESPQA